MISFGQYIKRLESLKLQDSATFNEAAQTGLKNIQRRHGVYPTDITWKQLKPETIEKKKRGNTPLLETGEMRDSYFIQNVSDDKKIVGTNSDIAVFHEFGTIDIPARPIARAEAKQADIYMPNLFQNNLNQSLKNSGLI